MLIELLRQNDTIIIIRGGDDVVDSARYLFVGRNVCLSSPKKKGSESWPYEVMYTSVGIEVGNNIVN